MPFWCWENKWTRTEQPGTVPTTQENWPCPCLGKRWAFLQVVLENPYDKMKLDSSLTPYIKKVTVKGKAYIKLLEENTGEKLYDLKVKIILPSKD